MMDEHHEHEEHGHHHHDHDHRHEHGHLDHSHKRPWSALTHFFKPHSHDAADSIDDAMAGSEEGIRAVKIGLLGLGVTAVGQLAIAILSGSVGLLADTIHNFADASTAIPLWLAFAVSSRPTNRSYTY